jgi:hexosaminidase
MAQTTPALDLMPIPSSVQIGSGQLLITPSFSVGLVGYAEPRLERAEGRFLDHLRTKTGMLKTNMSIAPAASAVFIIHVSRASKEVQELGEDESYTLQVTPSGVNLSAPTPLGALRGLQTFLQLVQITSAGFAVPVITIEDAPRFPWRGLMIDVSRHFFSLDVLKRNLDGMEAVKLNVFHWHLSDNQGFRVESKKLPKLQEMGSGGQYYTQDEVRELIAYARDRGIRVVPEFDMPGHSTAWFVGYPELASGPGPYTIEGQWGVFDPAMDVTEEHTYKFLDEFIGEMAKLFPDQFFHIGGDEVNGKQWDENAKIQAFMKSRGIKTHDDLQAYFNSHIQAIVSKHGKTMEGWDEILRPDLPKDVVIQSWRGQDSLASAAQQGYRGLLSYGYYLDLMWPASRHYAVDPMTGATASLDAAGKQRILGGEACEWSEYASPENLDSRIWPRAAAIAERLWSPQSVTDVNSMYARLEYVSRDLTGLGLTHGSSYESMLRRLAGDGDVGALRVLADVVEPVKDYDREELAKSPMTSATPLNRLIDTARPESNTAREFLVSVGKLLAGQLDPAGKAQMRAMLELWRDNDARLQPTIRQSFLLQEDATLSQNLSALGVIGLQAMDAMDGGQPLSDEWKSQQLAFLKEAEKPSAQLLLTVAPAVEKMVEGGVAVAAAH